MMKKILFHELFLVKKIYHRSSCIAEEYACNIFSRERTPPKVEDEFFEKYGLENFVRLHIYVFGNLVEFWTKLVSTHIYIAISKVVVPFPVKRNSRR